MANRFISFLSHVGSAFKKGLDPTLKVAATAGEVAVQIFAPEFSGLFHQTILAVMTAEQSATAAGLMKAGPQKLAAVVQLMGPLIKQALIDVGRPDDDAAIERYISSVVTILQAIPVPLAQPVTVAQPALNAASATDAKPMASVTVAGAAAAAAPAGDSVSAIQTVLP
jgi:hypothetical protein